MPNGYPSEQARNAARERLSKLGLTAKEWAEQNDISPSTARHQGRRSSRRSAALWAPQD
jgi:DNA-binding CsgD family transcriptional regulator